MLQGSVFQGSVFQDTVFQGTVCFKAVQVAGLLLTGRGLFSPGQTNTTLLLLNSVQCSGNTLKVPKTQNAQTPKLPSPTHYIQKRKNWNTHTGVKTEAKRKTLDSSSGFYFTSGLFFLPLSAAAVHQILPITPLTVYISCSRSTAVSKPEQARPL